MSFAPRQVSAFAFTDYRFQASSGELTLGYALDQFEFVERISFVGGRTAFSAAERNALERCFALTHLLAGISYYKAAAPEHLQLPATLTPAAASFLNSVYRNGLGEFAYRNQLTLHRRDLFGSGEDGPGLIDPLPLADRAVLTLGGGKDSLVSAELLRQSGQAFRTIAVGSSSLIGAVAARIGAEHIAIERRLDPLLFELNRSGALNGHVPISAILAGIMLCGAIIYGYDTVIMSNERSADYGNVILADGFEVNHQFSKTLAFEREFGELVAEQVLPGFSYFSLLRQYSELAIARRFAASQDYDDVFSSCNRNFQQQSGSASRWCGQCPKCRFVFLALAPFMPRSRLLQIFGTDLLADTAQLSGFRELLGLSGQKPFECVGEVAECRSALIALNKHEQWRHSPLVSTLGAELPSAGRDLSDWLRPAGPERIPARYRSLVQRLMPCA